MGGLGASAERVQYPERQKYYLKEHTKQRAFIVMPQVFIIKRARNGAASAPLEAF
jgi:hypothetical protein